MTSSTPSPEREDSGGAYNAGDSPRDLFGRARPGSGEHDFHDPHAGECHDRNHLLIEGQLGSLLEEIEKLDARMLRSPDTATTVDGTITSYRIPVGPWHRIIGIARGGPRQGR